MHGLVLDSWPAWHFGELGSNRIYLPKCIVSSATRATVALSDEKGPGLNAGGPGPMLDVTDGRSGPPHLQFSISERSATVYVHPSDLRLELVDVGPSSSRSMRPVMRSTALSICVARLLIETSTRPTAWVTPSFVA